MPRGSVCGLRQGVLEHQQPADVHISSSISSSSLLRAYIRALTMKVTPAPTSVPLLAPKDPSIRRGTQHQQPPKQALGQLQGTGSKPWGKTTRPSTGSEAGPGAGSGAGRRCFAPPVSRCSSARSASSSKTEERARLAAVAAASNFRTDTFRQGPHSMSHNVRYFELLQSCMDETAHVELQN
jgi:hypothetical protein